MRRVLVGVVALSALLIFPSVVSSNQSCQEATGCDDCGYFPSTGTFECAMVSRNAYCSCSLISNGCILDGDCAYTGSSNCRQVGGETICEEHQN